MNLAVDAVGGDILAWLAKTMMYNGVIANSATIAAPSGVTETSSVDNTATDTTSVTPTADLIIAKTDGLTSIAERQGGQNR